MRKRHPKEHRSQPLSKCNNLTQHAKGRTGDCPGPTARVALLCVDLTQGKSGGSVGPTSRREVRIGQGGRGWAEGSERPMGTAACGGKGFKGRAAVSGERPIGAASCRQQHNQMSCYPPSPPPRCRRLMRRKVVLERNHGQVAPAEHKCGRNDESSGSRGRVCAPQLPQALSYKEHSPVTT